MARLKVAAESMKFDKRLTRYNLENGVLSKEEYENHLNGLADLSTRSEMMKIEGEWNEPDLGGIEAPVNDSYYKDFGDDGYQS